jgi:2-dehydro-3-deoxyphosphooctonate aldolase (KDO 8-P synthase)
LTAELKVGNVKMGGRNPLFLIAGPCVIEDEVSCLRTAEVIAKIASRVGIGFVFKSSYMKDNRSKADAYMGPGLLEGLRILERIRRDVGVPVLSDVHCREEVAAAAEVLDIIQIPAYLSQQTRLALAAGRTGKAVNLKKGQFVAPAQMKNAVGKIEYTGNRKIILTERGSCFGYNSLVVDMRSFPVLASLGYPVVFDVTHSVRVYGTPSDDPSGGEPVFVPYLARAAVAAGCDGIFIETHENPAQARCDACSMLPVSSLESLLGELLDINEVVRGRRDEGEGG